MLRAVTVPLGSRNLVCLDTIFKCSRFAQLFARRRYSKRECKVYLSQDTLIRLLGGEVDARLAGTEVLD